MGKYEVMKKSGARSNIIRASSHYAALKKANRIRRRRYGKDWPLTTRKGIRSIKKVR